MKFSKNNLKRLILDYLMILLLLIIILIISKGCNNRPEAIEIQKTPYDNKWQKIVTEFKNYTKEEKAKITEAYPDLKYTLEKPGKDHWQTPLETAERGVGDCEDLALVYYFLNRKQEDIIFVIGKKNKDDKVNHAWLMNQNKGLIIITDPSSGGLIKKQLKLGNDTYIPEYGFSIKQKFRYS